MAFNINEIKSDLASYVNKYPEAFQAAILAKAIFLSKYARRITKVNGEYPLPMSLIGHVVQSYYSKSFTPFDEVVYKNKTVKSFRQKVDFQLDPAEILGTVYADKFDEGKKPGEKRISKEIFEMIMAKIISDLDWLSINGKYDATKTGLATPVFGFSMDGLNTTLPKILTNTTNPAYLIPGDAMTATNNVKVISDFEKNIPEMMKPLVKRIFTSLADKEEYQENYDNTYGIRPSFNSDDTVKTRFGKREIVGIPGLTKGTVFATIDNNFLETVDVVENPAYISDIQVQDRIVKVLSEFSLGYDFGYNQYLFLHTPDATKNLGLQDAAQNKLFYPNESKLS